MSFFKLPLALLFPWFLGDSLLLAQTEGMKSIETAFSSNTDIELLKSKIEKFPFEKTAKALVDGDRLTYFRISRALPRGHMYPGLSVLPRGQVHFQSLVTPITPARRCHISSEEVQKVQKEIKRMSLAVQFAMKFNLLVQHFDSTKNNKDTAQIFDDEYVRNHYHFTTKQWNDFSLTNKLVLRYSLIETLNQIGKEPIHDIEDLPDLDD
jgi:hypothetical protein